MTISAKKLLLLDGVGALITATLLSQVVARYESVFGMPQTVVHVLWIVALGFAAFSLGSYLLVLSGFERYLRIILFANLTYCLATAVIVVIYIEKLFWPGVAYFIGEIFVILSLVYVEYQKIKQGNAGQA